MNMVFLIGINVLVIDAVKCDKFVSDLLGKLISSIQIRQDFDCLMEGQTRFSEVVSGWRDKWVTAVDTYLSTHISKKSLGSKISDCNDGNVLDRTKRLAVSTSSFL